MADFEIELGSVPEGFGGDLDAGNYTAKLMSTPEVTETKQEKLPMLNARFEILEGPQKGREQVLRYVLSVTTDNGKPKYSTGLINLKRDLKNINAAIPEGFKLSSKNAVKFYGTKFKDVVVVLNARKYKPKGWVEGEDMGTSYSITGTTKLHPAGASATLAAVAGKGAAPEPAPVDDDEFA